MKQARQRRTNVVCFHLCEAPRTGKWLETKHRGGSRGPGGQKKGGCGLLGTGCLAGMLKRLQMDCADGYTTWTYCHCTVHFVLVRKRKPSYSNTYVCISLRKMGQINEPMCKAETETQTQRKSIRSPKGRSGVDELGDGADIHTLLCMKQATNENLLYSTGNSAQCSVVA